MNEPRPLTTETRRRMFGYIDADQRARMSRLLGREIKSRSELTEDDALVIIDALRAEQNRRAIDAEMAGS